jgi:hypothetical protein
MCAFVIINLYWGHEERVVMMGSRGCRSGDEVDALSQRSRRLLAWQPGEVREIKRSYWKRTRKSARLVAALEVAN